MPLPQSSWCPTAMCQSSLQRWKWASCWWGAVNAFDLVVHSSKNSKSFSWRLLLLLKSCNLAEKGRFYARISISQSQYRTSQSKRSPVFDEFCTCRHTAHTAATAGWQRHAAASRCTPLSPWIPLLYRHTSLLLSSILRTFKHICIYLR